MHHSVQVQVQVQSSSVPTAVSIPGFSVAMDSTPTPAPAPAPTPSFSASKLPIKRKTPDPGPNVDPHVSFPPITTTAFKSHSQSDSILIHRIPPFKFHRIWTEADELRFLQGLLDCKSENLSFPKDLNVFYSRFSNTMSQPYTKSQLSEKLRRLRKKYRVISTRLSKGLDQSFLTPHDRDLYQLCIRLWHPDYADTSPFGGGGNGKSQKSDSVEVQINVLPTLSVGSDPNLAKQFESHCLDDGYAEVGLVGEERLSVVNVEFEGYGAREAKMQRQTGVENSTGEEALVAKAIIDAFDESLKEVKRGVLIVNEGVNKGGCVTEGLNMLSFQRRWQEQRYAEMEALGRRMRLVFENSLLRRQ